MKNDVYKVTNKRPAVFLDRDGTLIEDVGWLKRAEDVRVYDETIPSLLRLQTDYDLFIVTNQGGISRGQLTEHEAMAVNQFLVDLLAEQGIDIRKVFMCPHHRSDGCSCIKPHTTFADEAASEFNIDLSRSYAIGDHPHDVDFGYNFGGKGVYVLTGHGAKHRAELERDELVFDHLGDAVDWIFEGD